MHSFAVIAGFAAAANAYAYGYPAQNATSVEAPTYPAASTPAGYVASSAAGYVASSAAAYPVSSKAAAYPVYTTAVYKTLSTVCSEATTLSVGSKTYVVTKPTTIVDNDCEYTTSYIVKSTPAPVAPSSIAPVKPSYAVGVPVYTPGVSAPSGVPYPSKNGTAPTYPAATGAPSSTKPAASQFTGAAATSGAAMIAIIGAVAAFL